MRTRRGEAQKFVYSALDHESDMCLFWPFSLNVKGYGVVRWRGRSTIASKVVCELAHGPIAYGQEAAHSCGNPACCNPKHLRAASSAENKADMKSHGTALCGERNPMAKLTAGQVAEIRKRGGNQSELARKFGVDPKTINLIVRGVNWAAHDLPKHPDR